MASMNSSEALITTLQCLWKPSRKIQNSKFLGLQHQVGQSHELSWLCGSPSNFLLPTLLINFACGLAYWLGNNSLGREARKTFPSFANSVEQIKLKTIDSRSLFARTIKGKKKPGTYLH